MVGAAVATSISYLSMFGFHIVGAFNIGFHPIRDLRPIPLLGVAGCTVIFSVWIDQLIVGDLLSLVVVPPVVGGFYLVLAVLFGAINRQELEFVAAKVPIVSNWN
ncbi:hypothetical protein [Halorarius litoreus]|uniref:hypothetical protein n=1 Tax=Halorarius litoreus TaxID=2962676 RepID=UPI0020CFB195|nr:hypothetical protein [Halorarius litoreus]